VVSTTDPQHISTLTPGVITLSLRRKVELAFSASRTSQCRNCLRYRYAQQGCSADYPTCPICALHHICVAHRSQNPTCPRGGNNKPVPTCCPTSPRHCYNSGNDHTAKFNECPARPVPAITTRSATPVQPGQDPMDIAVDCGPAPSTPPTTMGPPEVDLVTPRQPPLAVPPVLVLSKASAVLSPSRREAFPWPLLTVVFVLEMNNRPFASGKG